MGNLCPIQPPSDLLASPNLQPSLSLSGRGLGLEASAFHRSLCCISHSPWGGDLCPPQPGCRASPHTARSDTLCVFPDRPAHLGHAISGVLFQGGQPQGKQGALRAQIQMCTCLRHPRAQHSCLFISLASQTSLCKHLWECGQALSAGDKNMDSQFPHLGQS